MRKFNIPANKNSAKAGRGQSISERRRKSLDHWNLNMSAVLGILGVAPRTGYFVGFTETSLSSANIPEFLSNLFSPVVI